MKNLIKKILKEEIGDNIVSLVFYFVSLETYNSSDDLYSGFDLEKANKLFNKYDDIPEEWYKRSDISVSFRKMVNKYRFILEDENIDDYPIEDYYDDSYTYQLIEEGDIEDIEYRTIEPKNKKSDELLTDVGFFFYKKYGSFKYNKINVYDENDDYLGCIQLRISDHTENIMNIDKYGDCDYYISVVISDYDITKKRFGMRNAFERRGNEFEVNFDSDNNYEEIIDYIQSLIKECEENIINE